ncbi:hypothetical protein ACKWTF_005340 [Chironomus riparius]
MIENKISQTPKRSFNSSPSESQNSPKQDKEKVIKMVQYADKNDVEELKELIRSSTRKMDEDFQQVNNTLLSLRNDIAATKNEIVSIKSRVEVLEKTKIDQNEVNEGLIAELNALKQIDLETKMSIHNLPQSMEVKHIIESLSAWSKIDLNESIIKRASCSNVKNSNTSILFLDFYDLASKHKVMKHVRMSQKDKDKKYIPILTDHIFKLDHADTARGTELNFRDAMTEQTREIFNAARKDKTLITNVWLNQGYVMVRVKDKEKPIKIISLNHLNSIISNEPA